MLNQHPRIFLRTKFRAKMKIAKSRSKSALFEYFCAEIWKYDCRIWNQHRRCKIKNSSIWDQKCLIWVLLTSISKNRSHISNQHPRICLKAKFGAKIKTLKFETAYVLFRYFKAGIWKHYCHAWNQYSWIFLYAKVHTKIKILRFRTKTPLFEYFLAGIWKDYCHTWNQQPSNFPKEKVPCKNGNL